MAANAEDDAEFQAALEFFGGGGSAPVDAGESFFEFDFFGGDDQEGFL